MNATPPRKHKTPLKMQMIELILVRLCIFHVYVLQDDSDKLCCIALPCTMCVENDLSQQRALNMLYRWVHGQLSVR